MKNRELFVRDPLVNRIPNDGVAKVKEPETPHDFEVLRFELSSFVCDGEYERGLETILETYLGNLGRPTQPAVWVSGFYGSGKSHLARVLEFLWRDPEFPDGATARGLATLPPNIDELLRELSTAGRREGGLWSAAGTLDASAGDSARLAIVEILLRGAGLPGRYAQGRFVLWLMQNGLYEGMRSAIEAEGRDFGRELQNLYVSPYVAKGLLSVYPGFASGEAEARSLIRAQYPVPEDIGEEEMLDAMAGILALKSDAPGKVPCTILVLDELQQYIGESPERALRVQSVVEACSSRFGGKLLFVATGQSALVATAQLSKLQGRFTVRVALSDTDVEEVVRRVVLRKAPEKEPELERVLDETGGEISRHLGGTRLSPTRGDEEYLAADYPLLPTRRRFWERVLRAVDQAGSAGQLRTQLRVVQEAAEEVAKREVGNVVAADFIYDQISAEMVQSGALLRDVERTIQNARREGTADGELRSRLCALIFLIGQLPTDAGSDTGLRATVDNLADLMVEDLRSGGTELRGRIPRLLEEMVASGDLMLAEGRYGIQTREGAEWNRDFNTAYARVLGDDARIAGDRSRELREAASKALGGISFAHGQSKTPRKTELHFSADKPSPDGGAIPVWVRDEWSVSGKTFRDDAREAGPESPTVHVFLPRTSADELKKAIATHEAAREVVSGRPAPSTDEGKVARDAMAHRERDARRTLDATLETALRNARVLQGGGAEMGGGDVRASVSEAFRASLDRLFPRFHDGDHASWHLVVKRAREGGDDSLSAVGGGEGDVEQHPVCREVVRLVGGAGKKGREVRSVLMAPPFGWSQDAVDGALLALSAAGHLRVQQNGAPVRARDLDARSIAQADFRSETAVISKIQRIQVRKLFSKAGMDPRSEDEERAAIDFLDHMASLAREAGGEAPLPEPPAAEHLRELRALRGNEILLALFEARERLAGELEAWHEAGGKSRERRPGWTRLERLLAHAESIEEANILRERFVAIERNRALLDDPDPVPPLAAEISGLLRREINSARELHTERLAREMSRLGESAEWRSLDAARRESILRENRLEKAPEPRLGNEAAILDALARLSLSEWEDRTDALPARAGDALQAAINLSRPTAARVKLKSATLESEEDVDEYLAVLRSEIVAHIKNGRPVIL